MKILLPLFILLFSVTAFGQSQTVKTFYQNVCAGNFSMAERQLSAGFPVHKNDLFKSFHDKCVNAKGLKSFQFKNQPIDDNYTSVTGNVLFKDGSKTPVVVKLFKEKGVWKIAYLSQLSNKSESLNRQFDNPLKLLPKTHNNLLARRDRRRGSFYTFSLRAFSGDGLVQISAFFG